jgi:hypothetical protein
MVGLGTAGTMSGEQGVALVPEHRELSSLLLHEVVVSHRDPDERASRRRRGRRSSLCGEGAITARHDWPWAAFQ